MKHKKLLLLISVLLCWVIAAFPVNATQYIWGGTGTLAAMAVRMVILTKR
jgi:hypothetical protein